MEKIHILVVDDNPKILELIKYAITVHPLAPVCEVSVSYAYNGIQAIEEIRELQPDIIILDIKMPGANGYKVLRWARSANIWAPIIMLSALSRDEYRLAGFTYGCDEYLTKPFSPTCLNSAIRRQIQKRTASYSETLRFSDIQMITSKHLVMYGSSILKLTPREYDLLELFLRKPGQVLKRSLILHHVWGADFEDNSNIVDVYVRYLRRKLKIYSNQQFIQTVRGIGYLFGLSDMLSSHSSMQDMTQRHDSTENQEG